MIPQTTAPRSRCTILLATITSLCFGSLRLAPTRAEDPADTQSPVTVLHGSSVWRVLYSLNAPLARSPGRPASGPGASSGSEESLKEIRGKKKFDFMTAYPPDGWTGVDFDDAGWARTHWFRKYYNGELDSRAGGGAPNLNIRQISIRGKFTVTDPAKAGELKLTLLFRGGAAVYVNGREIARAHLPKDAKPGDPAEMYPDGAYLKPDGKPWNWWNDRDTIGKECYPLRVRRLEKVPVPADMLRKGTNVLAVEIHAAPYPAVFGKPKVNPQWCSAGLCELRLETTRPGVVVPNVARPSGMQLWNADLVEQVGPNSYGDPHEPLKPVRLVAPRNGVAAGRVIVSSDGPIRGLSANLSELTGPDGRALGASAAEVRYGKLISLNGSALRDDALLARPADRVDPPPLPKPDRWTAQRHKARTDDGLPAEITPGAYQPVAVVVDVPAEAAAGQYQGTLTISAEGEKPVPVPVELTVADWQAPEPPDFAFWFGLIQSPEGVALRYDVPLWSDRHLALLDRSFRLIAQTGGKVLFLHLTAETEYGNERSMVIWERSPNRVHRSLEPQDKGPDGTLSPDLSGVEKFVNTAVKHFKPTFVPVCVWQWPDYRKAPRITVRDAKTGALENVSAPANGTKEAEAFWRPVLLGVKAILEKAGLGDRMLLATGSDRYPDQTTVSVFQRILPHVGWEAHRHSPRGGEWMRAESGNVPVKYIANVWGQWDNWDPDDRRVYGWNYSCGKAGTLWTWLDRRTYDPAGFTRFRTMCEQILLADRCGLGQIGADFWPAPVKKGQRARGTLYSRFPHSANVGGGNKGCTTNQLFYPGPGGAVPTLRYQLIRENIQECEARIFLEKLLTADPCPLPQPLARKCRQVLDERTRWHRIGYSLSTGDVNTFWAYSGWQERTRKLFEVAGEAVRARQRRPAE